MEIKMGMMVETLVDLNDANGYDNQVFIPKGTTGLVCDTEDLDKGIVLVEVWGNGIPEKAWGVYSYRIDDLKVTKS